MMLAGSWQDVAFSIGAIIKIVGLLPSLRSAKKPAPLTSLAYGCVGLVFVAAYVTLGLWFSVVTTTVHSALWYLLAIQARRQYRA